jgi:hypothetical protein
LEGVPTAAATTFGFAAGAAASGASAIADPHAAIESPNQPK